MTNIEKKVSIIIPVYNTKEYLEECLKSVLSQDYGNLQIILIDDGSVDGSEKICDLYADLDRRIEVIHRENGGLVKARKSGLKIANGDYVGFLDSDDNLDLNMISTLVNILVENESDMVCSGYKEICDFSVRIFDDLDNRTFEITDEKDRIEFIKENFLDFKSKHRINNSICTKIFKRELINRCYNEVDDKQKMGEDAICTLRCILESRKISTISKALYNYRIYKDSMSHANSESLLSDQVNHCREINNVLCEYGYGEVLKKQIYQYYLSSLLPIVKNDDKRQFILNQYYFNDIEILKGKRVVIYGAGSVGIDYEIQLRNNGIDVVCFADKNFTKKTNINTKIISPDEIINMQKIDVVLIAIDNKVLGEEIKKELISFGLPSEKVCWVKPERFY